MLTHGPLTGSDGSQRFHWYVYEIGNAPFQEPTLAVRKWPTTGCVSVEMRLIVGYVTFAGGPDDEEIAFHSGCDALMPPSSSLAVPPAAATTARWPEAFTNATFVASGE